MKRKIAYYGLLGAGIAIMLLALVLSYTLDLRPALRFNVVGLVGLAGWGVAGLARKFRPRG